jgi:hypothetical protein
MVRRNSYAYAGGNPLSGVDPYGLFCIGKQAKDVASQTVGGAVQGFLAGGVPGAIGLGALSGYATYKLGVAGGGALSGGIAGAVAGGVRGGAVRLVAFSARHQTCLQA